MWRVTGKGKPVEKEQQKREIHPRTGALGARAPSATLALGN